MMTSDRISLLNDYINKSVAVIKHYQRPSGAYPAAPYFKPYQYCWFRDGSFIADGMSRVGQIESAEAFFDWCAGVVSSKSSVIKSGGKLDARYGYDGQAASNDWQSFQLDGFGTFLWALKNHVDRHGLSIDKYKPSIDLVIEYLDGRWQEPCFDWWEERNGLHAATLSCIYAGLKAFGHQSVDEIRQTINLSSERLDSSLLIVPILDAVSHNDFEDIFSKLESELKRPSGGVYRYLQDDYYGGGQWPVLAAMLGWYYARLGKIDEANQQLDWIMTVSDESNWLPEQAEGELLHPAQYQPWVQQWGNPAKPLLWSHGMTLTLISTILSS